MHCTVSDFLLIFFVRRALKPALKTFDVSVGLLCKLNIEHISLLSQMYSDVGLNHTECQCWFFVLFLVHRAIVACIVGLLCKPNVGHVSLS